MNSRASTTPVQHLDSRPVDPALFALQQNESYVLVSHVLMAQTTLHRLRRRDIDVKRWREKILKNV